MPILGRLREDLSQPSDAQLLKAVAILTDRTPGAVRRKVAWVSGEDRDARELSDLARSKLRFQLKEQLRREGRTIALCQRTSSQLVWVCAGFLTAATGLFWLTL